MADSKAGSVWAVAIVFLVSTCLTVLLRCYVRVEQLGKFGLDDKLVCVAQIFFLGYLVCQMCGASFGTGRHLSDLDLSDAETALRFWFFCEIWYSLANACVKVAICLSLRRVAVKKLHLWIIYGLIIWSIALGLAFFLGIIFQCIPTSDWWSLDPNQKRCLQPHVITSLTYTVSAINVACDWTLGIFPFFIVKDLAIPRYQKILVASILAFGALASTATIVRMVYIPTLEQTYLGWNGDFLYDTTPVAIWTTIEVGVAITAICLATLRPMISKALWALGLNSEHSWSYNSHSYDDHEANARGIATYDKAFEMPQGDFANVSRFNATRPVEFDSDYDLSNLSHFRTTQPLDLESTEDISITVQPSNAYNKTMTTMNTTRPLSTSFSDAGGESGRASPAYRRHAPG